MDLPVVGGGALLMLVFVIGYLLKANATDRKDCRQDYRQAIADCQERIEAEVKSRREIQALLDIERKARWAAESTAWIELRKHMPQVRPVIDGPDQATAG